MKILKNETSRSISLISEFMKHDHETVVFSQILPLLDYHKINTGTNFENPQGKSLDLKVKMWAPPNNCFWAAVKVRIFDYLFQQKLLEILNLVVKV